MEGTAPIAVLLALSCTLCVDVLLCVRFKTASLNLYVVCMFPVSLTLTLTSVEYILE